MRGEHGPFRLGQRHQLGSSPRARGASAMAVMVVGRVRLIPACAGSMLLFSSHEAMPRAHPRVRGEHGCDGRVVKVEPGSSPRARGAFQGSLRTGRQRGLIPACAGSIGLLLSGVIHPWAHPRVRGEHSIPASSSVTVGGSSPRARGASLKDRYARWLVRLIPACAGSISSSPVWRSDHTAHPRVRGEHCPGGHAGAVVRGSSPRARGA